MTFVAWCIGLLLVAGLASAALRRRAAAADLAFRLCIAAAVAAGSVPALRVLGGGSVASVSLQTPMPGGPWVFGLDALSALFLLVILWAGAASALFGTAYLRGGATRAVRAAHFFFATLLAALAALVVARAAVPFLIAWEIMALSSYAAIVFEHTHADVRRAGMLYLVATHAGTLALFALFAVWGSGARDLTFASLAARPPGPAGQAAVLAVALIGFGMKAGIVPLHFWLPEAHAAAPSHVSAVMSGVVIKMGIYGLLRVTLLLGAPPAWWGWLLLALGRGVRRARRGLGAGAARPQAAARLPQRGEHRDHPHRARRGIARSRVRASARGRARLRRCGAAHAEPRAVQEPALPRRRLGDPRDRNARDRPPGRARPDGCPSRPPRS